MNEWPKKNVTTYPAFSSAEPLRLFLRWLAVTGNGAAGLNPAPESCSIPTQTECERLSWNRLVGVPVGVPIAPSAANTDESDPDSRDSRRNRPITDLAALGLVRPPTLIYTCTGWSSWVWVAFQSIIARWSWARERERQREDGEWNKTKTWKLAARILTGEFLDRIYFIGSCSSSRSGSLLCGWHS